MGWVQGCLFSYSRFLIEMCQSYHTIHWIKNQAICHLVALETEFSFLDLLSFQNTQVHLGPVTQGTAIFKMYGLLSYPCTHRTVGCFDL